MLLMESTGFHLLLCWCSVLKGKYFSFMRNRCNSAALLFSPSPSLPSPVQPALSNTDTSFASHLWLPKPNWSKSLMFNLIINTPSFSYLF